MQTVTTLTTLPGLGPNCWWLCVGIDRLAMDFLDHHNPSEQSAAPTNFVSLTLLPRQG